MTNITDKEYNARKAIEDCPSLLPNSNFTPGETQRGLVTFLAISRLADAAERIANALEALNERDSKRYYSSSDDRHNQY